MRERMKDNVVRYSTAKLKEQADKTLFRARREVEINGNGTTGYVIKEGPQKGLVLKHIKVEPKNI